MKKAISSAIFLGMTVCSFAQGSFTIVKPFDGSKIRESVRVLVPKSSVPAQGYIGIFIDGAFKEAVVPKASKDDRYLEYMLNTKELTDGGHKIELKLYVDYSEQPRIIDTSSIDVTIANAASIPIPEDGIQLRYRFNVGSERVYRLQQNVITNVISEDDQKKAKGLDRAFELKEEGETIKLLYACDNRYGNGEGLLRMQVVPDKGIKNREYAYLTTQSSDTPQKFYPENMAPIYMRITPTGREVFGAVPDYFGFESSGVGGGSRSALFASFPLPVLPTKSIRPGDTWQTVFQVGALNLGDLYNQKSVVQKVSEAAGKFERVEWEMGHPCAVIKNSVANGTPMQSKAVKNATSDIADSKISIDETIWFALDTGTIIKYFRDITIDGKVQVGFVGGEGGAPAGGPPGAGVGPGGPPRGGPGKGGGKGPSDFQRNDGLKQRGGAPRGGPPAGGPPQGGPGGPGGRGPMGPGGMGQGGTQTQQNAFLRRRLQYLFVLEK